MSDLGVDMIWWSNIWVTIFLFLIGIHYFLFSDHYCYKFAESDTYLAIIAVRHEALTANEISQEKREFVHNSIEEQLKEG